MNRTAKEVLFATIYLFLVANLVVANIRLWMLFS